ncbi:MAG: uncharacterized protein QOG89_3219 [Thermomicrobiales bacterium]|nr:uncharacterized protein [Thermomicrobiales bacterium]
MDAPLRERLESDLKVALKGGDQTSRDTIRFTLAALKNAEIDNRGPLSESDAIALLQREAKRRADSIDQFRSAKRDDLVAREEEQLLVLRRYLPAALSDDDLSSLVAEVIQEVGAAGPKDMARVMPVLMERAAGRADGRRLSSAVREALAARA